MRITKFSDFALRVLIYLASKPGEELVTISQLATVYSISVHHVRSVVHKLGQLGYINSIQGKGGGLELAMSANDISIGDVIRNTESDFYMVDCFNPEGDCPIKRSCILQQIINEALGAFLQTLDQYTLADITKNSKSIMKNLEVV